MVDKTAVRAFMVECMSRGWVVEQADCTNAYINARMDQEVYIKMPTGFYDEKGKVRRLLAALYGHPRSGQLWYQILVDFIQEIGFTQSNRDFCFFFSECGNYLLIVYVDDILVSALDTALLADFFSEVGSKYNIRRLGFPQEFTGLQIHRVSPNLVIMHHQAYMHSADGQEIQY